MTTVKELMQKIKDEREQQLVIQTVQAISSQLAGKPAGIQGAILADLLATWLAGHMNDDLREELLEYHVAAVRWLIPINEAIILKRHRDAVRALS